MPIYLRDVREPLSPSSYDLAVDAPVIESDASRVLTAELVRYCRGYLSGRSFLISGHRGAGKTTLVLNAYQKVRNRRETLGATRPLLVEVNGPALFRDPGEDAATASPPDTTSPPGTEETNPAAPGQGQLALKQIVLALHRAVAEEICVWHRQRGVEDTPPGSEARAERLELSAQLELELFECPSPARLRQFWSRANLLERGVLYPVPRRPDQGLRELLALAGVCEAYCRVSGTFTEAQKRSETAARQAEASLAAGSRANEVIAPLAALLAGGAVGVGAHTVHPSAPAAATLAGIMAALGAAAVFRFSASRSSARSISRELSYMPDLSVGTLDRFIPLLIKRLFQAGLAPVFVVDELDKVPQLPQRMVRLLAELKKIFAETAFFCFITERRYFEQLRRITAIRAYPPASTYFSHQLFVVYGPTDLHRYLRARLDARAE